MTPDERYEPINDEWAGWRDAAHWPEPAPDHSLTETDQERRERHAAEDSFLERWEAS